jgi:hypothetical protein
MELVRKKINGDFIEQAIESTKMTRAKELKKLVIDGLMEVVYNNDIHFPPQTREQFFAGHEAPTPSFGSYRKFVIRDHPASSAKILKRGEIIKMSELLKRVLFLIHEQELFPVKGMFLSYPDLYIAKNKILKYDFLWSMHVSL